MLTISLFLSLFLRILPENNDRSWVERWQRSLFLFSFPPLLLLVTSIAVIWMGYQGEMLGVKAGWISYLLAVGYVGRGLFLLGKLAYQGWQSRKNLEVYPQLIIDGKPTRLIRVSYPYIAQVGFWQPELVVSQGLLNSLDESHLQAVLAHEKAHECYHDTFWFFWLGWLRNLTFWLPNTDVLWQELLFLREIRADQKAAEKVDSLLLAESLLIVAQKVSKALTFNHQEGLAAAFHDGITQNILEERIDALLNEVKPDLVFNYGVFAGFCLALLPLITIPLHY